MANGAQRVRRCSVHLKSKCTVLSAPRLTYILLYIISGALSPLPSILPTPPPVGACSKKVEISGEEDDEEEEEGGPQRLTVGIDDLVRVMPWFCIEVIKHPAKRWRLLSDGGMNTKSFSLTNT